MPGLDLVTGGAGFIGRHLVQTLQSAGRRVRVLDVAEPPPGFVAYDYARGSVTDGRACRAACDGAERVFHVAGDASLWRKRPAGYRELNVGGTTAMLAAVRDAGVRRFVHVSTDVVAFPKLYGPYARSKHVAETVVRAAIAEGLDAVIVRPGAPIGPDDANLTPPMQMLRFFLTKPPPAFYDGDVAWVDVRDLAAGITLCARDADTLTPVTIASPPEPMSRMVDAIAAVSTKRMPSARIPYAVALAAAVVSEATIGRFTGNAPIATSAGVRMAKRGRARDEPMNAAALGLRYRPLAKSVADAARWLAAAGLVPAAAITMPRAHTADSGAASIGSA